MSSEPSLFGVQWPEIITHLHWSCWKRKEVPNTHGLKKQKSAMRFLFAFSLASYNCRSHSQFWNLPAIHSAENQFTCNSLKFHIQFSKVWHRRTQGLHMFQSIAYLVWITSLIQIFWFWSSSWAAKAFCITYRTVRITIGNRNGKSHLFYLGLLFIPSAKISRRV